MELIVCVLLDLGKTSRNAAQLLPLQTKFPGTSPEIIFSKIVGSAMFGRTKNYHKIKEGLNSTSGARIHVPELPFLIARVDMFPSINQ